MTIMRRAFTASIGAPFVSHTASGCTGPAMDSGNPATSGTNLSGVRELVTMDQPDSTEVDLGHVSPDLTGIEATVMAATVDPSHRQCLFLWEEGNTPTATGPGSGGYDPAGFRPTVTSVSTTGDTTVKGAVLLCADGAFVLRENNSGCYPTATRLSTLGYHCFIVDYRMRPHTQAEAGYDLARATRSVRARAVSYSLPGAQHVALGGYSTGDVLYGETVLNWSGSTSPIELNTDYTPDALDIVGTDATIAAITYSFYGHLFVTKLDPSRLTGAVPACYCYGTKGPFYDQFGAQAKVLVGFGVTLRARVLDGQPHGFGAEGGWIEEYDASLQQAFAST